VAASAGGERGADAPEKERPAGDILDEALEPQHEDGRRKISAPETTCWLGSIDRVNLERAMKPASGYRIIFVLHDVEGYEHNEIAEMMVSIGNSKSQFTQGAYETARPVETQQSRKGRRR